MKIVLPAALTGIVTGIILAISRAIGETAPVLLVIGGGYINSWKPLDPVSALPLSIYENAKSEWPSLRTEVWVLRWCSWCLFLFEFKRPNLGIEKQQAR